MVSPDRIGLILPYKAEYVSVARLTASGVAGRAGFDIETIEDIKVAVSEVCSRMLHVAEDAEGQYEIRFDIRHNELVITFTSEIGKTRCLFDEDDDGLGLSIIKAFMDKVEFCPENGNEILSMTKTFEVISGDGI